MLNSPLLKETLRMQQLLKAMNATSMGTLEPFQQHAKLMQRISGSLKLGLAGAVSPMGEITKASGLANAQMVEAMRTYEKLCKPLGATQFAFLKSEVNLNAVQLASAVQSLEQDAFLLGEYQVEEGDPDGGAVIVEPLAPDVQQEVESRLVTVELLPVKLAQAVARKPELLHGIDSRQFEELIAELLDDQGFENVVLTPRSGDGGRDVLATRIVAEIPVLFAFECKRHKNKIGVETLRALLGAIAHGPTMASIGVLATTSTFTSGANNFIASEPRIDGKDFEAIVSWLSTYGKAND